MVSDGRARPILIVEDDPHARDGLRYLLEAYDYAVITAADGAEALDHLRRGEEPCVILLDLTLPGGGGAGFRQAQCQNPRFAQIPVIVLSGRYDIDSEAARLGVAAYCTKPIDCDTLLILIERHRVHP